MNIQWYPGHMAKAKRMLAEQLRSVDVVIEVCDARLPRGSRNPVLDEMTRGKKRILVLNKADLADPEGTREWVAFYRGQGMEAVPFVAARRKGTRELIAAIERSMKDDLERKRARGVAKTVRAMVVGIPNVGKSTLTNAIYGAAAAKTGDRPGVTRGRQWVRVGEYLDFLDTPGMLWPKLEDEDAARCLAYMGTIRDEIMDSETLAVRFLEDMQRIGMRGVMERLKIEGLDADGLTMLEGACRARGWIRAGGVADLERGARVILDEFRAGKMGTVTLERPESLPKW